MDEKLCKARALLELIGRIDLAERRLIALSQTEHTQNIWGELRRLKYAWNPKTKRYVKRRNNGIR